MPVDVRVVRRFPALLVSAAVLCVSAAVPGHALGRAGADGWAGASGEASRTIAGTPAPRSAVGVTTPGIDISHWQNEIDWTKVAAAGKRFAFMKATDDTDYTDPTFFANRSAARANGLMVGRITSRGPTHPRAMPAPRPATS
jgi:GH25 family lysozyme M1 (1,4-beta-N-acetylmuramidase)